MAKPVRKRNTKRRSNKLQVDPFLHEGRASMTWIWGVAIAAVVAVVVLLSVTGGERQYTQAVPERGPPMTTGASTEPEPAEATGRATSDVPRTETTTPRRR